MPDTIPTTVIIMYRMLTKVQKSIMSVISSSFAFTHPQMNETMGMKKTKNT